MWNYAKALAAGVITMGITFVLGGVETDSWLSNQQAAAMTGLLITVAVIVVPNIPRR